MERSLGVIRTSPWINIHKSGSVEKKLEEETVDLEVESENGRIFVEKKDLGGRKGEVLRRFGCGEGETSGFPFPLEGGRPFDFVPIRVVDGARCRHCPP